MTKKDEDLEAKLLADDGEPPSPGTKAAAAGNTYSLVCALLASLASIIYGYNRGVMSGAQKYVQADLGVTDGQLEVLIGLTSVYSLVGSLAAGWACDRAGRRRTVALSAAGPALGQGNRGNSLGPSLGGAKKNSVHIGSRIQPITSYVAKKQPKVEN